MINNQFQVDADIGNFLGFINNEECGLSDKSSQFLLIRTSFLWRGVYLAVSCMSRRFWPQDMGCCMDDPAEGIWQRLFNREIFSPFGLFRRQEVQFNRNSDKPLQHALFFKCVMTVYNHPTNIRGRRRRRFADVEHERDNQKGRIRCLAGRGFWAAALTGQARAPDA